MGEVISFPGKKDECLSQRPNKDTGLMGTNHMKKSLKLLEDKRKKVNNVISLGDNFGEKYLTTEDGFVPEDGIEKIEGFSVEVIRNMDSKELETSFGIVYGDFLADLSDFSFKSESLKNFCSGIDLWFSECNFTLEEDREILRSMISTLGGISHYERSSDEMKLSQMRGILRKNIKKTWQKKYWEMSKNEKLKEEREMPSGLLSLKQDYEEVLKVSQALDLFIEDMGEFLESLDGRDVIDRLAFYRDVFLVLGEKSKDHFWILKNTSDLLVNKEEALDYIGDEYLAILDLSDSLNSLGFNSVSIGIGLVLGWRDGVRKILKGLDDFTFPDWFKENYMKEIETEYRIKSLGWNIVGEDN